MNKERFETSKSPRVLVTECHGSLVVRSWSDSAVMVQGENVDITETADNLTIAAGSSLRLTVPEATALAVSGVVHGDAVAKNLSGDVSLHEVKGDMVLSGLNQVKVGSIHGDLSVKNMNGGLNAETVHGDAVFRNVGALLLGTVHGDLSARFVDGNLAADSVMGDVGVRTLNGDLTLKAGHRDANLRNLSGQVALPHIEGDIRLYDSLSNGEHTLHAGGDIIVRWPIDAPLRVTAVAPQIVNRLPLEEVVEEEGRLSGQMGGGKSILSLQAGGKILLREAQLINPNWEREGAEPFDFNFDFDLDNLGQHIGAEVSQRIARVTAELENQFGRAEIADKLETFARKAEKAASRAEKAAERARQRAERRATRAYSQPERRRRGPAASPTESKASADEQLKILQMVEKGIISPEEASMLLDALEE